MSLTLRSEITADVTSIDVFGDPELPKGTLVQIDSELLLIGHNSGLVHPDSHWHYGARRGEFNSPPTTHAAGAVVQPVVVQVQTGAPAAPPPAQGDQGGVGNYNPPVPQSDVSGLEAALAGKQPAGAYLVSPIAESDVTGLEDALAALPTADEKAALDAANAPDGGNPFATMADVGGTSVLLASLDIATADVLQLDSVPYEVVPTPGPGKALVPLYGYLEYLPGAVPFGSSGDLFLLRVGSKDAAYNIDTLSLVGPSAATSRLAPNTHNRGAVLPADVEDMPLTLLTGGAVVNAGPILTHAISAPGALYAPGDAITLTPDELAAAAALTVDTVDADSLPITVVVQGAKTFTVAGDHSAFGGGDTLQVWRSSANDGGYTIVSAIFGAGVTVITVVEAIPSATADGFCADLQLTPAPGGVATYTMTAFGLAYPVGTVAQDTAAPVSGTGFVLSMLSITPSADGTLHVTLTYLVL
jgi:hypothetical protein